MDDQARKVAGRDRAIRARLSDPRGACGAFDGGRGIQVGSGGGGGSEGGRVLETRDIAVAVER